MTHSESSLRLILALAVASVLAGSTHAQSPGDNALEIVIGNGPYAGTYKPPPSDVLCMDAKQQKQFTAVYKDFDPRDPKKVSEAAINIENPAETGPRQGQVLITFGDPGRKPPIRYSLSIARENSGGLTFTRTGKGADLSFQGRTSDGIALRLTAKCTSVDVM
jgi:hypothetical protein